MGLRHQIDAFDLIKSGFANDLDDVSQIYWTIYMALDVDEIAAGAVTATQIRAAYEPMNSKADQFEYCVLDFLKGILAIAGLEDNPTFTRSTIVNTTEEIQNLVAAGVYLDQEYVTEKILNLLGDGDKAEEILKRMAAAEIDRGRLFAEEGDVIET